MFNRREDSPLKIRFKQAEGKEVREDLFLFSCYETERTRCAADDVFPADENRWPALAGANKENIPEVIKTKELSDILTDILVWYRDNRPEMSQTAAFDHQLMNDVVTHLVVLKHDLDLATRLKTGAAVPVFERATTDTFWEVVEKRIRQLFPNQCHIYLRYLQWCYAEDMAEVFEPGSRPPVGKYAPPMRRNDRFSKSGGGGRDRGGDRGGGGGGGGRDRGPRPQGDRPDRGPQPRGEDFGNNKNFSGGGGGGGGRRDNRFRDDRPRDRGDRGGGRDHGGDRDRNRGPSQQRNPELEQASLSDVSNAVATLASKPDMQEFALKPTNSFYRRLQHQQVAKAGLYSYSQGVDPDRCVVITRDPNSADS